MSIRAKAWVALLLPPMSWFLFEQGLSAVLHADCSRWLVGLVWGAVSLASCGLSAWIAWPLRTPHGALVNPWLAQLGMAIAALFALAIAYQSLAIAMVPACLR
jgi:hypothetical protein